MLQSVGLAALVHMDRSDAGQSIDTLLPIFLDRSKQDSNGTTSTLANDTLVSYLRASLQLSETATKHALFGMLETAVVAVEQL